MLSLDVNSVSLEALDALRKLTKEVTLPLQTDNRSGYISQEFKMILFRRE